MKLFSRLGGDLRPDRIAPAETADTLARCMVDRSAPGLGAALIRDGRIKKVASVGAARASGRPVSAKTFFQAASISKLVAAFVVFRLVHAGQLDLNADVGAGLRKRKTNGKGGRRMMTLR